MKTSRRQFIGLFTGGIFTTLFLGKSGGVLGALAADKKGAGKKAIDPPAGQAEASPSDALVGAIGYIPDATKVDKKKYPQYKAGQACGKCALYTKLNDGWGKCQMIANGVVRTSGWCGSFNAKT